jgi:hypothetical protein
MDGVELGLDADHLDVRAQRLGGDAMPAISPPPPIGTDQRVDLRRVLQQLERDRALAGDDLRVVERVDEGEAALRLQLSALGIGLVEHLAVEHDVGAVALRSASP